mgnify:CR=1 FL=1
MAETDEIEVLEQVPRDKRLVWEDMLQVMEKLEMAITEKQRRELVKDLARVPEMLQQHRAGPDRGDLPRRRDRHKRTHHPAR